MSENYLPANPFAEWLGRTVLSLMGWRIEGKLPQLDKFVVIGAHHTSNWDFVIFLAVKFVLRLNVRWFGVYSGAVPGGHAQEGRALEDGLLPHSVGRRRTGGAMGVGLWA